MKFETEHHEHVHAAAFEANAFSGDVASPTGAFGPVFLEPGYALDDGPAAEYFNSRHLIVVENNDGVVSVLTYLNEQDRDEVLENFEQAYHHWAALGEWVEE